MGCTFQPKLMQSSIGTLENYNTISSIGLSTQDAQKVTNMAFKNESQQSVGVDMGTLAQQMVDELLHGKKNVNDYLVPLQIS